jgi:hypothetical protein
VNRPDELAENAAWKFVADLELDVNEYKGRQRTSGRSGVLSYQTANDVEWDLEGTVGFDADVSSHTTNFTVTFTGDGSQAPVIANLSFVVYVQMGSSPVVQLTALDNLYQDGSGRDANLNYNVLQQINQTTYVQTFYLLTDKEVNYFIKAYAVGSSRGTLTVTSP